MRKPTAGKRSGGGHPVGESQNQPFQLSFNKFLRVDFQGSRVTSDSRLLVVRELDERLGLTGLIQNHLLDTRTGVEYTVSLGGSVPTVRLQPAGWVRRPERCHTAGARGESDRFGEAQSRAAGPGGGSRLVAAGGVRYGQQ